MTFDPIWSLLSAWILPLMTELSNEWIIFHSTDWEALLKATSRRRENNDAAKRKNGDEKNEMHNVTRTCLHQLLYVKMLSV